MKFNLITKIYDVFTKGDLLMIVI